MAASNDLPVSPGPNNINDPDQVTSDVCYPPVSATQPRVSSMYPTLTSEPPSYEASLSRQQPMCPPSPLLMTQMHIPHQCVVVTARFILPQTVHIRDYIVWSAISVITGGFILGFIAILLSMQTRKRKREGNIIAARNMSRITLIFNIIITVVFFALTALAIVHYVYFISVEGKSYR